MAMHGFRGLGWFLCSVLIALPCYMVTSHGAAERSRLRALESAIVQTHKDIRALETEFDTRANLAQIERWNGDVLAMNAPAPQQYLANVNGLAALDRPQPAVATAVEAGAARVETAALVIPAARPALARDAGQGAIRPDQIGERKGLMRKADPSRLAMAGPSLLSASTIEDLRRIAEREQLALH